MGIPWLQLIDFDHVEESNIASQGFLEDDLGRPKVQATADLCQQINHQLEVHEVSERFRRSTEIGNAIFCCVDSIETRRLIWEAVRDRSSFYVDGRMSAEVLRVLTACDEPSREHYPTTLFSVGDRHQLQRSALWPSPIPLLVAGEHIDVYRSPDLYVPAAMRIGAHKDKPYAAGARLSLSELLEKPSLISF